MTEVWMRLDQLTALVLANLLLVIAIVAAWIALMVCVVKRGGARWRPTRPLAVFAGIVSTVSALFMVPGLSGLSFGAVANWSDWITLLAISLGSGVITFAFAWPAVATAFRAQSAPP